MCNTCQAGFRIEACDLGSGRVKGILHPISMDWETMLNQVGQGTITVPTKDVAPNTIWPGNTSIYITRVSGPGASFASPVCEGAMWVERYNATESNTTSIGLKTIEHYLFKRIISQYTHINNTTNGGVASRLVNLINAEGRGIPLSGVDGGTAPQDTPRTYQKWDYKKIGDAVQEVTEARGGPDWRLDHYRVDGAWHTVMVFIDDLGAERNYIIKSNRDAKGYTIDVSAVDIANRVFGIGEGTEAAQLNKTAEDPFHVYPLYDDSISWPDVRTNKLLTELTEGHLDDHLDPVAVPDVSLAGLENPPPNVTELGDKISLDINFGAVTYRGRARITGRSWSVNDSGISRTLSFTPITRTSESVRGQNPDEQDCKDC